MSQPKKLSQSQMFFAEEKLEEDINFVRNNRENVMDFALRSSLAYIIYTCAQLYASELPLGLILRTEVEQAEENKKMPEEKAQKAKEKIDTNSETIQVRAIQKYFSYLKENASQLKLEEKAIVQVEAYINDRIIPATLDSYDNYLLYSASKGIYYFDASLKTVLALVITVIFDSSNLIIFPDDGQNKKIQSQQDIAMMGCEVEGSTKIDLVRHLFHNLQALLPGNDDAGICHLGKAARFVHPISNLRFKNGTMLHFITNLVTELIDFGRPLIEEELKKIDAEVIFKSYLALVDPETSAPSVFAPSFADLFLNVLKGHCKTQHIDPDSGLVLSQIKIAQTSLMNLVNIFPHIKAKQLTEIFKAPLAHNLAEQTPLAKARDQVLLLARSKARECKTFDQLYKVVNIDQLVAIEEILIELKRAPQLLIGKEEAALQKHSSELETQILAYYQGKESYKEFAAIEKTYKIFRVALDEFKKKNHLVDIGIIMSELSRVSLIEMHGLYQRILVISKALSLNKIFDFEQKIVEIKHSEVRTAIVEISANEVALFMFLAISNSPETWTPSLYKGLNTVLDYLKNRSNANAILLDEKAIFNTQALVQAYPQHFLKQFEYLISYYKYIQALELNQYPPTLDPDPNFNFPPVISNDLLNKLGIHAPIVLQIIAVMPNMKQNYFVRCFDMSRQKIVFNTNNFLLSLNKYQWQQLRELLPNINFETIDTSNLLLDIVPTEKFKQYCMILRADRKIYFLLSKIITLDIFYLFIDDPNKLKILSSIVGVDFFREMLKKSETLIRVNAILSYFPEGLKNEIFQSLDLEFLLRLIVKSEDQEYINRLLTLLPEAAMKYLQNLILTQPIAQAANCSEICRLLLILPESMRYDCLLRSFSIEQLLKLKQHAQDIINVLAMLPEPNKIKLLNLFGKKMQQVIPDPGSICYLLPPLRSQQASDQCLQLLLDKSWLKNITEAEDLKYFLTCIPCKLLADVFALFDKVHLQGILTNFKKLNNIVDSIPTQYRFEFFAMLGIFSNDNYSDHCYKWLMSIMHDKDVIIFLNWFSEKDQTKLCTFFGNKWLENQLQSKEFIAFAKETGNDTKVQATIERVQKFISFIVTAQPMLRDLNNRVSSSHAAVYSLSTLSLLSNSIVSSSGTNMDIQTPVIQSQSEQKAKMIIPTISPRRL